MTKLLDRVDTLIRDLEQLFADGTYHAGGWRTTSVDPFFERFLNGLHPSEWAAAFDEFAREVASTFLTGKRDFENSDLLINTAENYALALQHEDYRYPGFFESAYRAFDAGEWDHHRTSADPIAEFTVPMLQKLLVGLSGTE
ncbi:MAG: hypothetical protein J2O44_07600 [Porphyrobacter sp.]|nr:hypothetical protein [Porphyrobacter sp.]